MRQLFEKNFHERLQKLNWELSAEPRTGFCYFIGSKSSKVSFLPELNTVMGRKTRLDSTNGKALVCDCFTIGAQAPHKTLAALRDVIGQILSDADAAGLTEICIYWDLNADAFSAIPLEALLTGFSETLELACYAFKAKPASPEITVTLMLPQSLQEGVQSDVIDGHLDEGCRRGQAINYARFLGDLPGNALTPDTFARIIEERLANYGGVTTIGERELQNHGFGGLTGVGQGSKNRPRLVVFESGPSDCDTCVVIIGKGITFDTGGYSIKGKQHHNEMKFDMCGAANAMAALEILQPKLGNTRLVGIFPLAENSIGPDAQRPGDVLKTHSGKTVEVYNTDAEGRLILADALSYAAQFHPKTIIDIATLTGGTTAIAGNMAGIFCTNAEDKLPLVKAASRHAGEAFVYLEILEETQQDLKSDVADLTNMHNSWSSGAATMYSASFLNEFVPEGAVWIHLDIANVAWSGRPCSYLRGRGATGYGTRSIVGIVSSLCAAAH
jgi:leucyl aminopeptidase